MIRIEIRNSVRILVCCLIIILIGGACSKANQPSAPAHTTTPAPSKAPAPAPVAAPTPSTTPAAPAPTSAARQDGQPLLPGGPPFYQSKVEKTKGYQVLERYSQNKMPLWTTAKYGGEWRTGGAPPNPASSLNYLSIASLSSAYRGQLLTFDSGLCSLADRKDFSKCDGKYARNNEVSILPGIFERWEQSTPTTYVFYIRKGVLWPAVPPMNRTDRTVTSADMAWFFDITKKEGVLKDNFAMIQSVEALDRTSVKITLQSPYPEFMLQMAHQSIGIFPKECYDEKDCLGTKLVSPAPFLMGEFVPRQKVVLEKNPEFWLKGLPYIDRQISIAIPDFNTQKAAIATGQLDQLSAATMVLSDVERFKELNPQLKIQAQGILAGANVLRPQIKGPMADVRVRRAMAMTIDVKLAQEVSFEGFDFFPTLVSRDAFGADFYYTYEQAGEWYQFNAEAAKKLMAEAGFTAGFTISVTTTEVSGNQYDKLLFIQYQWKKYLGIDLKINSVDASSFLNALYSKSWPDLLYQTMFNVNYWPSSEQSILHLTKGSVLNYQNVDDSVISDIYLKQRSELDPAKRRALLWQFEQRELDQVYVWRIGMRDSYFFTQPWTDNFAMHQVAYNNPWYMVDVSKQPKR